MSLPTEQLRNLRHDLLNHLGHVVGFAGIILDESAACPDAAFTSGVAEIASRVDGILADVRHSLGPDRPLAIGELARIGDRLSLSSRAVMELTERVASGATIHVSLTTLDDLKRIREALEEFAELARRRLPEDAGADTSSLAADGTAAAAVAPADPTPTAASLTVDASANSEPPSSVGVVLIVDDHDQNRQILTRRLQAVGLRTLTAGGGTEALALVARTSVDLILLDVRMPDMDGYTVCRRLKACGATADIPIVFLTAAAEPDEVLRGLALGAVDYIVKPFHTPELLARVRTHLGFKLARDELARYAGRLADLNRQKDSFLKIASHDLRNPLHNVQQCCRQMTAERDLLQPQHVQLAQNIESCVCRMLDLVENFLNYQKAESGSIPVHKEALDVRALVDEVMKQQRRTAAAKRTELRACLPESLPTACGDAARTHQIFTNFVTNAVKFSPPGSTVTVTASPGPHSVRVNVQDEGPGVPEAERDQLFREFGRLSNRGTAGEESTGLGLAIVKRLAEAQGGEVGAEFPDRRGSVFWFSLPLKD